MSQLSEMAVQTGQNSLPAATSISRDINAFYRVLNRRKLYGCQIVSLFFVLLVVGLRFHCIVILETYGTQIETEMCDFFMVDIFYEGHS